MTAQKAARPRKSPGLNVAAPQGNGFDWESEAKFWRLKYFESLLHSTQVITALGRPMLADVVKSQQAAQQAAANASGVQQ